MSKKVTVNEANVLELWSKGYNDKQVRMYLGLSVSTWDRWKKAYKQRTEVSEVSEVSTEVSETKNETPVTSVPQWSPSTINAASNVGRGGVRYRYTDPVKYGQYT